MKNVARILQENTENILFRWETKVKEHLKAGGLTTALALQDHLPHMLSNMINILQEHDRLDAAKRDEKYNSIITHSIDHGRYRATMEHYDVEQVILEYKIFHQVIIDTLEAKNAFDLKIAAFLREILEVAMIKSAAAFSESIQKVQEKLLGTVVHDLRNPLTVAYNSVDMMEYDAGPEHFEKLKKMAIRSLDKSIKLTEGLLDSITIKAGQGMMLDFREGDYVPEVEQTCKEACEIFSKDIRLNCPHQKVTGTFDRAAIKRVLENLITNAIKYGHVNEPVTVTFEDCKETVCLHVHNSGNPIPEDKQQSIFDFLVNNNPADKNAAVRSWGIGLSLVKLVTEGHGGYVKLESTKEKGTTFSVILKKSAHQPGKKRVKIN